MKHWADQYETIPKHALAARLTKRNMKVIAKAISDRLDTIEGSVVVTDNSIRWNRTHLADTEHEIKLGYWLVMNVGFEILSPYEFKHKYREQRHMPSYYVPTENEVKIINALTSDEYFYGYDYICDETGLSRAEAKEAIDKLRMVGVVKFARGLMNEDGEVCGSGFGIEYRTRAEALLYRFNDRKIVPIVSKWWVTNHDAAPENKRVSGPYSSSADAGRAREILERFEHHHNYWIEELES
jgi:hypothetical protein